MLFMGYQSVFKRYEMKYLLTQRQKEAILAAMEPYMALDEYGRTTIVNIYYDTDSYRLVRHSIEKPPYKEKLRIRSYGRATADSTVFVELKKKYEDVVYKRRISMPETEAMAWMAGENSSRGDQIAREIDYFLRYYGTLYPAVLLSYEREAYFMKNGDDFRVTFDDNILSRREDISLEAPIWGTPLLREGQVLMEIKCSGGIPMWMVQALSAGHIYKTSFSKYGTAYQKTIFQGEREGTYV